MIERTLTTDADAEADATEVVLGYCQAVCSALSQEGRPPLNLPGLKLQERLSAIEQSVERIAKKGHCPKRSSS